MGEVAGWYRGIVHRGLERANVLGVQVAIVPGALPPSATYDVSWTGR